MGMNVHETEQRLDCHSVNEQINPEVRMISLLKICMWWNNLSQIRMSMVDEQNHV